MKRIFKRFAGMLTAMVLILNAVGVFAEETNRIAAFDVKGMVGYINDIAGVLIRDYPADKKYFVTDPIPFANWETQKRDGAVENCYISFIICDGVPVAKLKAYPDVNGGYGASFSESVTDEIISAYVKNEDVAFGFVNENDFMYSAVSGFSAICADSKASFPPAPDKLYKITDLNAIYPAPPKKTYLASVQLNVAHNGECEYRDVSYTCWCGDAAMKLYYHGKMAKLTAGEFYDTLKRAGYGNSLMSAHRGEPQGIIDIYNAKGYSVTHVAGGMTTMAIYEKLSYGKPIQMQMNNNNGMYHHILITGIYLDTAYAIIYYNDNINSTICNATQSLVLPIPISYTLTTLTYGSYTLTCANMFY